MERFIWLVGGTAILPDRLVPRAAIELCDETLGRIETRLPDDVRADQCVRVDDHYIAPGFIDIHVHGGDGADFMDGTPEAVRCAASAHLHHGTTTLFPTSTTGSPDEIRALLAAVAVCRSEGLASGSPLPDLPGIHLYGPYFAPEKVGCHPRQGVRIPEPREWQAYLESGLVRIATCAAELPGAADFYRAAAARGCLITGGHSNASWSEMRAAFELGLRHVDHFWCAMSNVASVRQRLGTPMQGSMLEFVLAHREMSTEIIADGQHLAPELLQFAWQMKSSARLCLVSDCSRALDQPPGLYRFGHRDTGSWFEHDGHVGRSPEGGLASSVRALDWMVRHMAAATAIPLPEIIRMATLTPAQLTGLEHDRGSLAPGKRADLVVLTPSMQVSQVYLQGKRV